MGNPERESKIHSYSFLKAPFFPILFFYIAGLLLPPHPALHLFLAALFLSFFYSFIKKGILTPWLCPALIFFFAYGQVVQTRSLLPSDPSHVYFHLSDAQKGEMVGVVASSVEKFEQKARVMVECEKISVTGEWTKATGLVRVDFYGEVPELKYGDRLHLRPIKLSRPHNFQNPGGFDYVRYLRHRGIYAAGWTGKDAEVKILERGQGSRFFIRVHEMRRQLEEFAEKAMQPRNASVFQAMIFGRKNQLSQEDEELFIATGIAHLTAVSGLNIGFVAFVSYFILEWMGIRLLLLFFPEAALAGWSSRLAALFSILPVLFYALVVGESVSCIRAAIMAIVFLLALAARRSQCHYYTLATAALFILIWKPDSLHDAGFQLSFAAVFFILFLFSYWTRFSREAVSPLTSSRWEQILAEHPRLAGYFFTSLFAMIGVLPIIACYFNRLSPLSLPLNMLAVPLSTVIVTAGLFLSFLSLFLHGLADLFAFVPEVLIALLLAITEFFALLPWHSVRIPTPSPGVVAAFYLLVIGLTLWRKQGKKLAAALILALLLIIFFPGIESRYPQGKLSVVFLDVGQGDAAYLQFPDGKAMLIDGGRQFGERDMGEWVVGPFLWDVGRRRLDYLVASHPDGDHIGGLSFIASEFSVGVLLENGEMSRAPSLERLRRVVHEKSIPRRILRTGDVLEIGGARVEVFNPAGVPDSSAPEKHKGDNNRSLVMRVGCGDFSVLFTGDIEGETEKALANSGGKIRSTVLKVPHHGSDSSSTEEFIRAIGPKAAVVSVDAGNRFGHPDPKVLRRYAEASAGVWRTDRCGAVEIITDCREYEIRTQVPCDP